MAIFPGRYTAQTGDPFVIFLIGMRINRPLAVRSWLQVAKAMPPMIAELMKNPNLGLLHAESILYWPGLAVIQYWRSFEHLHAYSKMKDGLHLPAWAEFNRRIGNNGAVGIWHETFIVQPGNHEAIYVNMPRFGLAAGVTHAPVTGRSDTARARMQRTDPAESNLVQQ